MTVFSEKSAWFLLCPKALVIVMGLWFCGNVPHVCAQTSIVSIDHSNTLRGTVVNSVTHAPVGRALVYSPDNHFAAMTDSQGHFEFLLVNAEGEETELPATTSNARSLEASGFRRVSANRPTMLMARKTGFLFADSAQGGAQIGPQQQEVSLSLIPEALVVGHVVLPGSEDSERIQVELFRHQVREGHEHWDSAGSVMSKSNGEFRFAELPAGAYKLFTHELLDRDPVTSNPRAQLFGYSPVYYPAATDFATAGVIHLSPGGTFQANISPVRREYYPVKVRVVNAPPGGGFGIQVWPQGIPSPGYSLGYNQENGLIEGLLPNGAYAIRLTSYGPNAMTGILNFSVNGAALSGPAVALLPVTSITVKVKEEFQNAPTPQVTTVSNQLGTFTVSDRRPNYLSVTLVSAEELGAAQNASLRQPTGPEDDTLVIENVQPGRYRVNVSTNIGYASLVTSGGVDLLRKPLVVVPGGATTPIEITVRDDGAEIEGILERTKPSLLRETGIDSPGQSAGYVYFVPVTDITGQLREAWVSPDGKFQLQQIPPGAYRVLAFDRQQPELEYANEEAMKQYESTAQVIQLGAGQKERVRVPVIASPE